MANELGANARSFVLDRVEVLLAPKGHRHRHRPACPDANIDRLREESPILILSEARRAPRITSGSQVHLGDNELVSRGSCAIDPGGHRNDPPHHETRPEFGSYESASEAERIWSTDERP